MHNRKQGIVNSKPTDSHVYLQVCSCSHGAFMMDIQEEVAVRLSNIFTTVEDHIKKST